MIDSHLVSTSEAVSVIGDIIKDPFHLPKSSITQNLNPIISNIRSDTKAFVEYPYVDKVYRDSFYNFFSTKHYPHERYSGRISFFENDIKEEHFRNENLVSELQNKFLGFITVRPTFTNLLGRSHLSPKALQTNSFLTCLCESKVTINGIKLRILGFPHASQDAETLSCAETSIWEIMEYFGNKYPDYTPVLPSKIHQVLSKISYERQLPSHGLTLSQISYSLREFNFGTRVYSLNLGKVKLQSILDYYIESGIPVITSLETNGIGHAVLIVGREKKKINEFYPHYSPEKIITPQKGIILLYDSAEIKKKYVVMDDNFPAYQLSYFDNPGSYYPTDPYKNYCVTGIVVPLYTKIYTEATTAKKLTIEILKTFDLNFPENEIVLRLFLISSRSLKNEIALNTSYDDDSKDILVRTPMPKFVWVSEFSTKSQFENKEAFGLIILNATDSSIYTAINSIIFPNKTIVVEKGEHLIFSNNLSKFNILKNNLIGDW